MYKPEEFKPALAKLGTEHLLDYCGQRLYDEQTPGCVGQVAVLRHPNSAFTVVDVFAFCEVIGTYEAEVTLTFCDSLAEAMREKDEAKGRARQRGHELGFV